MNTATLAHDNMAIAVFAKHVVRLPAGGYGTTQFDMTDAEREELVEAGRQAMRAFLASQTVLEGTRELGGADFAPTPSPRGWRTTRLAPSCSGSKTCQVSQRAHIA